MRVLLSICLSLCFLSALSQVNSVQSGDWDDSNTWDCNCVPSDATGGPITILHNVSVPGGASITADEVFVDVGGTLTIESNGTLQIVNGPGNDLEFFTDGLDYGFLEVHGTLALNDQAVIVGADQVNANFHSGSRFRLSYVNGEGSVPIANWNAASTLEVNHTINSGSVTATAAGNWNQSFGNVVINITTASSGNFLDFAGRLTKAKGNIEFQNTGPAVVRFSLTSGTLDVDQDFIVSGSSRFVFNQSGTGTVDIGRDFIFDSSGNGNITTIGTCTVNVSRHLIKRGTGNLILASATSSGSGVANLNVRGDFELSDGQISKPGASVATITFLGSGVQTFIGGGSFADQSPMNFIIASGSTLDLGENLLGPADGVGAFTCNGTVRLGSTDGGGAVQGNILVNTRTFNPGSTIVYDGDGPQFMSFSTGSNVTTVIDNADGVELVDDVTIGGNLVLTSGNLKVNGHTLTLSGTVTANGNAIEVDPSSSIVVNGSGTFGTFPFPQATQTFSNFTLDRPAQTVTFAVGVVISGAVTLTNGTLAFPGQNLTLNGTFAATNGALSANNTSTLNIGGTGAFGTLEFAPTGNTLGTLTLNRNSGTVTLDGNLVITEALNLDLGQFNNVSGLTLAHDATLTRANSGQLSGQPILTAPDEYYNVTYTGEVTTGVELPDPDQDNLKDLTIDGGPVTLSNDIIVHGDVNLLSSSLIPDGHTITLAGNPGVWNRQSGTFVSAGSTVIVTGDITVTASTTPQLHNLTLSDGSTLTTSAGRINISGNLLVDAGSTFNHNNGTLAFNGSADQDFGGAGKTYNNIIVDKSGGNLQFTSSVNLTGRLTIESSTTVITGGVLTLLSTSDGATGNGSIGPIPSGASISGNVSVRRYMSEEGRIYRYISSPIQSMTVAQIQAAGIIVSGDFDGASPCAGCLPSMYWWDETLEGDNSVGYIPFPSMSNSESMEVGRGYATFVADDVIPGNVTINYSGTINSGDISLPVTYTETGNPSSDGWNLVGNPYPSSIDWDQGWTKARVSPVIAIRNNGDGGVYQYWDGTGDPNGIPSGVIATGQAFWVRATDDNPVLTIHESAKSSLTGIFFRENVREENIPTLAISLKKGTDVDVAYYKVRKNAKPELDDLDGPKLNNVIFDISTLTPDGISMAINATDKPLCGEPLRLRIQDVTNGTYQISAQRKGLFEGYQVTLVDKYTSMNFDLTSGDEYEFTVTNDAATKAHDRFSVILTEPAIDPGNLIAELSDNVCADGHYKITLNGAQTGVSYFAELDGKVLGDSVMTVGTDPITLSIPASELEVGVNELTIKGFNYCTALAMNDVVSVEHDVVYTALSADKSSCGDDVVTLEASGAPANGSYNWYEEETSATPIEGQHGSTFVTPSLPKSATYYVAAVNALGCEGPRVPVKAIINEEIEPVAISGAETGELVSSYDEGNQWYFNGAVIEGETGPTYTATESGTYTVVVNVDGCETSASVDYLVTGVDEVADGRLLQVERNPFVDELRIRVVSPAEVTQMSVFDNVGALIGNMELRRSAGSTEGVIDMKQAASGMYFVRAMVKDEVYTLKVIKK